MFPHLRLSGSLPCLAAMPSIAPAMPTPSHLRFFLTSACPPHPFLSFGKSFFVRYCTRIGYTKPYQDQDPKQCPIPSKMQMESSFGGIVCKSRGCQTLCQPPGANVQQRPVSEICRIRDDVLQRKKSAVQITEDYLSRLHETEPHVKSFLYVSEKALEEAAELDRKLGNNEEVGPLAGVPIAVKDNLCTHDMPSTGGSRILEGYRPPYDATAVRKLREAGAVLLGKTNLDEFGMGSSTEGSAFQVTSNPWDLSRVPGGSSGGSAAAVAARQCAAALGTDTGGSIRQPASFCGVVGLKPTYGRVSRFGLMAYASSLDVIGCLASSVLDTAILLSVMAGEDKSDATSSKKDVPTYAASLLPLNLASSKPFEGLKFGIILETIGEGVNDGVLSLIRDAALHIEALGATVTEVSLPTFSKGLPAYYVLAPAEASSNLARYDGVRFGFRADGDELVSMYGQSRGQGFGLEVKRRILMGTYALSAGYYEAFYRRSQQVRTLIQKDFRTALEENDVLLSPVAPTAAFKIGSTFIRIHGSPSLGESDW
ncbi:hypothetical protein O6H91_01G021800 [Diphasiastrum complanatum]|uniref:Uncharacterized protein n=1 Tax=Diphasiastrum complanatum TaxID=34168 RepID=A0ACC2ENU3_DIPCM|nr:hypothetical protein O6H91_01G021800 [Diphasiastrum complanatum]